MKGHIYLFGGLTAYFALLGAVYIVWTTIEYGSPEWAGSTALVLSAGLSGLIGTYVWLVKRNQGGELVEDKLDSDIDDGDPEIGEFSPWSWWPVLLAFSASAFLGGFALNGNFFITFFSIPFIIISIVGWVYEYYRGYFAR